MALALVDIMKVSFKRNLCLCFILTREVIEV